MFGFVGVAAEVELTGYISEAAESDITGRKGSVEFVKTAVDYKLVCFEGESARCAETDVG